MTTPIALFVYRRPAAIEPVLDALEACPEFSRSPVFVFSDGPRDVSAVAPVGAVRDAVRARLRDNMTLIERPSNLGLAASIIAGTSEICDRYGRVIVLEDDHIVSARALTWFNAGLDRFEQEHRVMQVAGYMFDVPEIARRGRGVFLYHPTSWGWATWTRAWKKFDPQPSDWRKALATRALRRHFEVGGVMRFADMMVDQMEGISDSWSIRWHHSVLANDGLVLFPPQTMIRNIGVDVGRATHGHLTASLLPVGQLYDGEMAPPLPDTIELDAWALAAYQRRLRRSAYGLATDLGRVRSALRRRLRR